MHSPRGSTPAIVAAVLLVFAALAAFADEPQTLPGLEPGAPIRPACPPAPGPAGPLSGCAAPLADLAEVYRQAHEKTAAFARERSEAVAAVFRKEEELKSKIEENSAQITKLELKKSKSDKNQIKELKAENKKLWKSLNEADAEKTRACRDLRKATSQHVDAVSREIALSLKAALAKIE